MARTAQGWEVRFGGAEAGTLLVDAVVNSAGLGAQKLARATEGYPEARVPRLVLAKGNYFGFQGKPAFSHLIYPAPVEGGLGTHVTLDMAGRMRFGPDVEWIDARALHGRSQARGSFYASVRTYFPGLPDNSLVPDYCGIRPKLTGKGEPAADFLIDGPAGHGLPRLVHLFGIESPGLTSALSIAEEVVGQIRLAAQSSGFSSIVRIGGLRRLAAAQRGVGRNGVARLAVRRRDERGLLVVAGGDDVARLQGRVGRDVDFGEPERVLAVAGAIRNDLLAVDERVLQVGVARAVRGDRVVDLRSR